MNDNHVKFKGTQKDFEEFIKVMQDRGLDVSIEAAIPVELEGSEFEFTAIQILTIIRLSQELATRLQVSTEEVEAAFVRAACAESCSLTREDKLSLISRFYGCFCE